MTLAFRGSLSFAACAFALAFGAGCGGGSSSTPIPQESPVGEAFRSVAAVYMNDTRYGVIKPQVINSEADIERLIAATDRNDTFGPIPESAPLIASLRASNVNFDQEALVVLERTSGGGGVQISLDPPQVLGRTFVSTIRATETGSGGGAIEGYAIYVFAVSRARVDDVKVEVLPLSNLTGTSQTIRLTVPDR